MRWRRVVLFGPPGAGKGTHAAWLADELGVPHVSTGEMLRDAVRAGSELGERVRGYMDAGRLVPDDLMIDVLFAKIAGADGWVLDGFPRTLAQADALDRRLAERGEAVDAVLEFVVDAEEIVERLSARLTCPNCGAVYNLKTQPPERDRICDRCGTTLVQRDDDREDAVRERLRVYHEQTQPVADYYRARGLLHPIEGSGTIAQVRERIAALLAEAGS